jgi:hypothetical protein
LKNREIKGNNEKSSKKGMIIWNQIFLLYQMLEGKCELMLRVSTGQVHLSPEQIVRKIYRECCM